MQLEEARQAELRTRLCGEFMSCLDTTTEGVTPGVSEAPPSPSPSQAREDGDAPRGQGGDDEEVNSASGHSLNLAVGEHMVHDPHRTLTPSPPSERSASEGHAVGHSVGAGDTLGGLIRARMLQLRASIAERREIIRGHNETLREYRERPPTARPSVRIGQGTTRDAGLEGTRSQPGDESHANDLFGGLHSGGLEVTTDPWHHGVQQTSTG
ncbi:hypothetical protein CYMTET_44545 [Cymbomonas tetramitiformis]|uniref:Uncharacterized protein n=1 Tax=Cymbomonas tetramitiformis TaxID=36881 RepID=A0AAE0C009_9CHLO|nr:hypothetical protein CYMTET_44545 [Cymbomonas tetramitiformis]